MKVRKAITLSLAEKWLNNKRYRINYQNKNWLCAICGDTGSGKSYSALSIGYQLGGAVYTVFSPMEFLQVINNSKVKKGDVIIFDEAGVGMSSRDWYKLQNKLLGSVLQTFRNMNMAVIFTMPNISFIDAQARKLFHNFIETVHIDFEKEIATIKVFDVEVNNRYDKTYYKYPVFNVNNKQYTLKTIGVPKPSEKVIYNYEKKKQIYTNRLNREALEQLSKGKSANQDIAGEVVKNKSEYLKIHAGRQMIDRDRIASDFHVGRDTATRIKKEVERTLKI